MKNIIIGMLAVFMLIGCTTKVQTDVNPYVTLHQNEKQDIKIYFLGVNDKRETMTVSTIFNDNEIEEEYSLSANVKKWYEEAFIREFKNAQMLSGDKSSNVQVTINIKNISATYAKYSLDTKNMKANVLIELVIRQADKTITSQIEANQTLYKPMILDAAGFETIINESMRDSVSKTVEILIKKIKE